MARLTRAAAGERVFVLADRLSDALLGHEALAQVAVERKFTRRLPDASKVIERAARAGLPRAIRDRTFTDLTSLVRLVLEASRADYLALLTTAADLSLDSMAREMTVCEQTLAKRYAGAAVEVVADLRPVARRRVPMIAGAYAARFPEWLATFEALVEDDWRASASAKEPPEVLARRMFDGEALKAPGHSGRGDWWKPYQWVFAEMRGGEFVLVNEIRRQVIADWNRAMVARG